MAWKMSSWPGLVQDLRHHAGDASGSSRSTTSGIAVGPSSAQSAVSAVLVAIDQHDAGARREHGPGAFEPDAGGRAGDGGDLSG